MLRERKETMAHKDLWDLREHQVTTGAPAVTETQANQERMPCKRHAREKREKLARKVLKEK